MNTSSSISIMLRTGIIVSSLFFAIGYTSIASAAQGCGHGYHRNMYGMCVLNAPGPNSSPAPYHPGCWRNAWVNYVDIDNHFLGLAFLKRESQLSSI